MITLTSRFGKSLPSVDQELRAVWTQVQKVPASLQRAHSLLLSPMGPRENGADS